MNRRKRDLPDGRTGGAWCVLGEARTTAQIAASGIGWLCLDAQHGAFDDASVLMTMQTLAVLPKRPPVAVRIAELSHAAVGRALDVGADIVIVPMVETVAEAEAAVRAAHYPPVGGRSWGPMTSLWGAEAPSVTAQEFDLWVMLETRAGLEAAGEILAVAGVTGVFVGPIDLSLGLEMDLNALLEANSEKDPLPAIITAARNAGKQTGAYAGDPVRAEHLRKLGFDWVAAATDAAVIAHGTAGLLDAAGRPKS